MDALCLVDCLSPHSFQKVGACSGPVFSAPEVEHDFKKGVNAAITVWYIHCGEFVFCQGGIGKSISPEMWIGNNLRFACDPMATVFNAPLHSPLFRQ
jgi:hypothetical protein